MVIETGRAEKLPPHDIEAEEAVIASLLVDPEAIYRVAPTLKPEDFFREKNAWAFEACLALWERNQSINQITVSHELARRGRLEEVGGAAHPRPETLIAAIRQGESLRDFVHVKELLEGYLASADSATNSVAAQARAITTGFMDLDTLLGGLNRSDPLLVA